MDLKPQDIVLLLKLVSSNSQEWSFAKLGAALRMSASHAFESALRAENSRLLKLLKVPLSPPKGRRVEFVPHRGNLTEFLVHGVKYAFPAERGGLTRGIPTAEGASPLREYLADGSVPPVWPYAEGDARGLAFSPLYKNVPAVARVDAGFYELVSLLDAIRGGRAREREIAITELTRRIGK